MRPWTWSSNQDPADSDPTATVWDGEVVPTRCLGDPGRKTFCSRGPGQGSSHRPTLPGLFLERTACFLLRLLSPADDGETEAQGSQGACPNHGPAGRGCRHCGRSRLLRQPTVLRPSWARWSYKARLTLQILLFVGATCLPGPPRPQLCGRSSRGGPGEASGTSPCPRAAVQLERKTHTW